MHRAAREVLAGFEDAEGGLSYERLNAILALTAKPVSWAYDVWDVLVEGLTDPGNHRRTIAAQLLSNLASSDPKKRILKDLDRIMAVTHDERFVTARHTLQAVWRIGLAGKKQREAIIARLAKRFEEAADEKPGRLIRYDIAVSLRQLYDATADRVAMETALRLIDTETDARHRKKYLTAWRGIDSSALKG